MSSRLFNMLLNTGISVEELRAFAKSPIRMARCAAIVKNSELQIDGSLEWLLYGVPYAATPKIQNCNLFNRAELTVKDERLGEDFIDCWQRPARRKIVSLAQVPSWGSGTDFLRAAAEMYGDVYLSVEESIGALSQMCLSLRQADRFAGYMIDSFNSYGLLSRQHANLEEPMAAFRLHQPVFVFVKLDFDWSPVSRKSHSRVAVMEMRIVSRREVTISLCNPKSQEYWGPGTIFVGANIQD